MSTLGLKAATHFAQDWPENAFLEHNGRNRGYWPDKFNRMYGMLGEPYCAMGLAYMIHSLGPDYWNAYGGNSFFNPFTGTMVDNAQRLGWVWHPRDGKIPAGSIWIEDGIHVCMILQDIDDAGGLILTKGFNESDGIRTRTRDARGAVIVVPPKANEQLYTVEDYYWLQDPKAEPYVAGTWRSIKNRDAQLEKMRENPKTRKFYPRPHSYLHKDGKKRYIILAGALKRYGPFDTVEMAKTAQRVIEKRLGRKLRRYRTLKKEPI